MSTIIKKISFVITDMSSGGAERVMSLLANYFCEKGIETQIIAIKSDRKVYPLDEQIDFHFIGAPRNLLKRLVHRIKTINQETADSDVIISFLWHCNVCTLLANLLNNRTIIISERSDPSSEMRGLFKHFKWFRNIVYHRANKIVFQTQDARDYYNGSLKEKGIVIPNPLTPGLPSPLQEHRKELIAAGRLTAQKNMPMMVKAFSKVHNYFPDYKLTIYGEGEERENIEDIIRSLHLESSVSMPGFCNNLLDEVIKAKLFLSSSDFEGISNSIIEALALGIPVVATDCPVGGSKQFVSSDYNGALVPMKDENAFAKAIINILSDSDKWNLFSKNASEIRNVLSITKIGEKWIDTMIEARNE